MKKAIVILVFLVLVSKLYAQNQSRPSTDSLPTVYIGLGTGINSFTGILGVSASVRVYDKLFIRGGLGFSAWGSKCSVGLKYDRSYRGGFSYNLGYSYSPGLKDLKLNMELASGAKQDVTIDYLAANTLNASMTYSWMLGKKNTFYLEFGYAVPFESTPWEVKDGSVLSSTSKSALSFLQPGGVILGVGFTFGI